MKKVDWDQASEFEGPKESPGFLLWQVSTKWRRLIEATLAQLDLTHPQFVLLAGIGWLTKNQEMITQVELARHCNTDINMTSQILRSLEKKGLIARKQRSGDVRSKCPHLTPKGTQLIEKAIPLVEQVDRSFFGQKSSESVQLLASLLQE